MNEAPKWERGDTLRSVRDVFSLARVGLARVIENISEFPSRLDTRAANQLNGNEDEEV